MFYWKERLFFYKAQYTDSREAKNLVKSIQISKFFHHVKQEVKCVGEFFSFHEELCTEIVSEIFHIGDFSFSQCVKLFTCILQANWLWNICLFFEVKKTRQQKYGFYFHEWIKWGRRNFMSFHVEFILYTIFSHLWKILKVHQVKKFTGEELYT